MPIIAAAQDTEAAAVPEAWDAELHIRYVPPVPQVPLGLPVTPVMATVPSVMTPVLTPAPPMMPPPGMMSPSMPPGTENPQADEGPLDNELCSRNGHVRGRELTTRRRLLQDQLTMLSSTSAYPTAPLPCQPAMRASFQSPPRTKRLWTRRTRRTGCIRSIRSYLGSNGRELSE